MLRRQAKWVFVLLALVFAGGFVLFGVGSGSNGLGNVLQNWLNIGQSSSGASISKLEAAAKAHPTDAKAFRDLATAYETKQRTSDAIGALQRYTALRPKDTNALQELAGLYQRRLQTLSAQLQALQSSDPFASGNPFAPPATTPLGQAYASTSALGDPVQQAVSATISQRQSQLSQQLSSLSAKQFATYKTLVKLDPTDPNLEIQLGQSAQVNGDTKTAIAAYERFLKLSPDDPLAPRVKQVLKQLQPSPKPASKSKQGSAAGG